MPPFNNNVKSEIQNLTDDPVFFPTINYKATTNSASVSWEVHADDWWQWKTL